MPEDDPWDVPDGTIDVWWRGMTNGGLMLLLAHLLHQNPQWRRNRIRVLRVVDSSEAESEVRQHIENLCATARIAAEPGVVVHHAPELAIQQVSAGAAVVVLGMEVPPEGDESAFVNRMEQLAGGLPRVLFVCSAGGMELESRSCRRQVTASVRRWLPFGFGFETTRSTKQPDKQAGG